MIRTASMRQLRARVCAVLALFLAAGPAWALQVTNINDFGSGSLRAAVAAGGNVTFAIDGQTIVLTNGAIAIPDGTTITGPGADRVTIDGDNHGRIFEVASASIVAISGLTLKRGRVGQGGQGGAIINAGTLVLDGVEITDSQAGDAGGAVYNTGSLQVHESLLAGNTVVDAACAGGGAIRSEGVGSELQVVNSTVAYNEATACNGGGISFNDGHAFISTSSIVGNTAGSGGGNIYKGSASAQLDLRFSVVVDGSAAGGSPANVDLHGAFGGGLLSSYNLVGERGDAVGYAATDLAEGTDPQLDALAIHGPNGGATRTIGFVPGSPLRNVAPAPCGTGIDQRGAVRPQGSACDIGAFEYRQHRLTATATGGGTVSAGAAPAPLEGGISNCGTTCTADYGGEGVMSVTLIATPDAGRLFVGWSGACVGTLPSVTVPMDQPRACTATFIPDTVVVTPSAGANGALTPGTPQAVTYGSTFAFTVTPDAHYHIDSVSGCGGTLAGNTYTTAPLTADCTVNASFAIDRFTVVAAAGPDGTISPSGAQTVDYGSILAFTLTPATGHHIAAATGCGGSLVGNIFTTAPITAACAVDASFAIDQFTVSASAGTHGAISPSGTQTVDYGSTLVFTLTPETGYHVDVASGCGGTLAGNTYTTAPITAACAVNASFAIDTFSVTASAGANGTISPSGTQTVDYGSVLAFTVTPAANHHIASVSGCGGTLAGNIYTTAPITAACSINASFTIDTFTVTPSAGPDGAISPATPQTVDHGDTVVFTLTPDANHHIDTVTGCGGSLSGSTYTTAAITADCAVVASFAIDTYTVTASAGANGAISPNGPQPVDHGDTLAFTLTPDTGYHIDNVTGCDGSLSGSTYTTGAITADCAVTASFAIDTFTVTASAGPNGAITPTQQTVDYGTAATLTVTPDANHHIDSVTGCDGTLVGDTYTTAPVTADCAVTATFTIDTFTVTATAGPNGTITPTQQTVDYDTVATLTVTPDAHHHIDSVTGCGGTLAGTTYTTAPVTADCAVDAAFAIDTHTIGGSVGGLLGSGLVLQLNGADDLAIGADGSFVFATPVESLEAYEVTVGQQPGAPAQVCSVANGSGTVGDADVTDVVVSCAPPQPLLALQVDDDREYTRYGMLVDYVVTLTNSGDGDANGVAISDTSSAAIDAAFIRWHCFGAGAGADCVASGTGPLEDANVSLPAGRSLTWLVTAPVRFLAPEGDLDYAVDVAGGGGASASDHDILVVLRTGFDVAYDDGAESSGASACAAAAPGNPPVAFDLAQTHVITLPSAAAPTAVDVIARALDANGSGFRIERLGIDTTPRVRVVTIDADHVERAGAWAAVDAPTLSIGSVPAGDGVRVLLVEGTRPALSELLPAGVAPVLRMETPPGATCE